MPDNHDTVWMKRALRLATRAVGRVEPNPLVGAIIVRPASSGSPNDVGVAIGEGYHRKFGGPHAEVEAIASAKRAGHDVEGATLYVTLEPCAHTGKTPPCVDAIIAAKIGRVVAAIGDPFPEVAGAGFKKLMNAGIEVEVGVCEEQARDLAAPFLKRLRDQLPWVIGKWAQTLDGRIAAASGDSRWVSGEPARKWVHRVRARVDAVMIGINTALQDDPLLTARGVRLRRLARRVVVDPRLRLPIESKLMQSRQKGGPPVIIAAAESDIAEQSRRMTRLRDAGAEIVPLRPRDNYGRELDLKPLLRYLMDVHQATNVLVEGGAGLMGQMVDQNLLDQAYVFMAPKILGDANAVNSITGRVCEQMDQAIEAKLVDVRRFGDDVRLEYRLSNDDQQRDDDA